MNPAEDLLAMHLTECNLSFERQFRYAEGRKLRADFALPAYRLLIEVTGGIWGRKAHGSIKGVLADIDRLNEATRNDWRMFRFTPDMVESGQAIEMIADYTARIDVRERWPLAEAALKR